MRAPVAALLALLLVPGVAEALPSFARDSGMPCVACHTTAFGPSLTPEGEAFKLRGYSLGGKATRAPLNALALASFTRTSSGQGSQAPGDFHANDNLALDEVSLVFAGPLVPKLGALAEVRYDGVAEEARLGKVDIRYADAGNPGGYGYMVWGLSLNNSPSVQDLWNTSPAWSFPFATSGAAPRPAGVPLIEDLENEVYGVSAYTVLYDYLYMELGGYRGLGAGMRDLVNAQDLRRLEGSAPYWRLAGMLQLDRHAWRLGAFGLSARLRPDGTGAAGADGYLDFTYDATYSYRGPQNHLKLQLAYTQEAQDLDASVSLGLAQRQYHRLRTYRATGILATRRAMTWTASTFVIEGTPDAGLYPSAPVTGSASHQPDSRGTILEAAYGTASRMGAIDLNYRVGLQLTHYERFNGARHDYDGDGRDAADNDTLFCYLWIAI